MSKKKKGRYINQVLFRFMLKNRNFGLHSLNMLIVHIRHFNICMYIDRQASGLACLKASSYMYILVGGHSVSKWTKRVHS